MTTTHIDALEKFGSVRKAAEALSMCRSTFFDNLNKERSALSAIQNAERPNTHPVRSGVHYFIFTAATRGAKVHTDFLANLEAYSKYLGAKLIVGPLTSLGRQRFAEYDEAEFDPLIVDYISDEPLVIGDRVRFSPELNLTPTMVKPLQGLQTYTRRHWGIFPHTKISLETVATHKDRVSKFIATTGAVTHPHYTPTKAGFRAHFDHVHGAIILEVSKKGVWFRHLTPANEIDGTFYDLGNVVRKGNVGWNSGVTALIYGDIHVEMLDPAVAKATWGIGAKPKEAFTSLAQHVQPETQIFHDLMDMTAANYHELDNLFNRYDRWYRKKNRVDADFADAFEFLNAVGNLSAESIIVDSNHDYFIDKWMLKFDPAAKEDFDNIDTFYRFKLAVLDSIRKGKPMSFLETLLRAKYPENDEAVVIDAFRFLKPDESFEIDNIECGWHGHRGPNGRRGSKHAFKFVTEKCTVGHMHSPSIDSGCHVVGVSARTDMGYNAGPSSWAHTHGIIYPHGGRALLTMSDDKFWATQGDV